MKKKKQKRKVPYRKGIQRYRYDIPEKFEIREEDVEKIIDAAQSCEHGTFLPLGEALARFLCGNTDARYRVVLAMNLYVTGFVDQARAYLFECDEDIRMEQKANSKFADEEPSIEVK